MRTLLERTEVKEAKKEPQSQEGELERLKEKDRKGKKPERAFLGGSPRQ